MYFCSQISHFLISSSLTIISVLAFLFLFFSKLIFLSVCFFLLFYVYSSHNLSHEILLSYIFLFMISAKVIERLNRDFWLYGIFIY